MLLKTFKYYHSLKCKPESEEVELPLEPKEEPKEEHKVEPVKELQAPSTLRHIQRREFFKKLTQNAF